MMEYFTTGVDAVQSGEMVDGSWMMVDDGLGFRIVDRTR
jgi:hypothetical protein